MGHHKIPQLRQIFTWVWIFICAYCSHSLCWNLSKFSKKTVALLERTLPYWRPGGFSLSFGLGLAFVKYRKINWRNLEYGGRFILVLVKSWIHDIFFVLISFFFDFWETIDDLGLFCRRIFGIKLCSHCWFFWESGCFQYDYYEDYKIGILIKNRYKK